MWTIGIQPTIATEDDILLDTPTEAIQVERILQTKITITQEVEILSTQGIRILPTSSILVLDIPTRTDPFDQDDIQMTIPLSPIHMIVGFQQSVVTQLKTDSLDMIALSLA